MADQAVIDLVRRFEPILYFHPDERFFPSDAKRYVEHCALWKAEFPFDRKNSWGGKNAPFPREPLIEHKKIAASSAPGEVRPGQTYIGSGAGTPFLVDTKTEERFLELAGWKLPIGFGDPATVVEVMEPSVDGTSENRYYNRAEVDKGYETEPLLRDSRFWYHAEFFDGVRLRDIMAADFPQPSYGLSRVFAKLAPSNPALLCYYFFFPAHDEPLAQPCDGEYSGREFGGFAGEWQAFAILLARPDASAPFQPRYFGCTGRMNLGTRQGWDEREPRVRMTVSEWKVPEKLETVDDHAKLFVSLGTHSLYPYGGTHNIQPYNDAQYPQICGRFDGPDVLAQRVKETAPEPNITGGVVKVISGYLLGPVGLAAALIWVSMEENFGGIGTGTYDPPTNPQPDEAPLPQALGKVVHPKGLALAEPGAELVEWTCDENVEVAGRKYNFIVDRQTQRWWPSTNLASGYRGRWGPRVHNDPFDRRAGMRFPSFWLTFIDGLVKVGLVQLGP